MRSAILALAALAGAASAQLGLTYTPYTTQSGCKSEQDMSDDFSIIYNSGAYSIVRLYDSNCDSVSTLMSVIQSYNQPTQLFVGVGTNNFDNLQGETQAIINQANGNWSMINTISVGNEGIQNGIYTADNIQSYVSQVQSQLQSAGYYGPVVSVNIFYEYLGSGSSLCSVGDYVACNAHPFYDGGVYASNAGSWVVNQHQNVVNACNGSRVVITESGWPSAGDSNGDGVPSYDNQQSVVAQLREDFSTDLFLFSAFNEYWKSPGSLDVEQHWGFLGDSPSSGP